MAEDPERTGSGGKPPAGGPEARATHPPPLYDLFRGAWASALDWAQDTEQEARRTVDRLVELVDLPRAEAERLVVELRDALTTGRRQLEQRLEEDVRAYLSRLRFPSREDLSAMTARVEGLEARTSALERKR